MKKIVKCYKRLTNLISSFIVVDYTISFNPHEFEDLEMYLFSSNGRNDY